MNGFKQLIVRQKAMDLAVQTYRLIEQLPGQERFALADQLRRAAISVPSNIAEGYARKTTDEYVQFLHIAKGSNAELQTQLLLRVRIGYFTDAQIESCICLSAEVSLQSAPLPSSCLRHDATFPKGEGCFGGCLRQHLIPSALGLQTVSKERQALPQCQALNITEPPKISAARSRF